LLLHFSWFAIKNVFLCLYISFLPAFAFVSLSALTLLDTRFPVSFRLKNKIPSYITEDNIPSGALDTSFGASPRKKD